MTSSSVVCEDGAICPSGTACHVITLEPAGSVCARPDELESCAGKPDYASCDAHVDGRCYSGVCQPGGCGNGRRDHGVEGDARAVAEVCDDGNRSPGDGCSADCLSDETCTNGIVDLVQGEQCDDGNARTHDGCSSNCQRETPAWSSPAEETVGQRFDYALAYDAHRERVVLFGGRKLSLGIDFFDDTLEWDGARWHPIPTAVAPSSRIGAAMAFDAHRGRVVLFGGLTAGNVALQDTWEWDGVRWQLIGVSDAPPARFHHAMAYDPIRRVIVVSGGRSGPGTQRVMDTWEWDGATWTRRETAAAPSHRYGHAMAFDPTRGVMTMFGGRLLVDNACTLLADTWDYDGTNWSQATATGPTPRFHSAMTTDPATGHVFLLGGTVTEDNCATGSLFAPPNVATAAPGVGALGDAWTFDGTAWTSAPAPGFATAEHQVAPLPSGGLVTVAVYRDAALDRVDTFERTSTGWQPRDRYDVIGPPSARSEMAASYDTKRDRVVLFGGTPLSSETFIWNGRWEVGTVGNAPSPRSAAAMAYDEERDEHVLFGGTIGLGDVSADTWIFRDGWTAVSPSSAPPARSNAAIGYDPISKRVILFGGSLASFPPTFRDDTWMWNGTTWERYTGDVHPSLREGALMAIDRPRGKLILFGGNGDEAEGTTSHNDTWEWDGAKWVHLELLQRPAPRGDAAMAYDPARERIVLFGGTDSTFAPPFTDTWEWDGATWSLVPVFGDPPGRIQHAMTTAPGGSGVLVFGGLVDEGLVGDLEILRHVADGMYERCGRNDTDGDARIGCEDPDCARVCTGCGDGTCAGAETCSSCPGDCGTCVSWCGDFACTASETCAGDCATGP